MASDDFVKLMAAEELLTEIANSGVTFQDGRVDYVEIQVSADTWKELEKYRAKAAHD